MIVPLKNGKVASLDGKTGRNLGYLEEGSSLYDFEQGGGADDFWISDDLAVYHYRGGQLVPSFVIPVKGHPYYGGALSPDGKRIALPDAWGYITLMEVDSQRQLLRIPVGVASIRRLMFTADGKTLLFGVRDTGVGILDGSDHDPTITLDVDGPGRAKG